MCGRFTHMYSWRELHRLLSLNSPEVQLGISYNVAPTQTSPIVRGAADSRELVLATWGLTPHWAEKAGPINARAEMVAEKPMFRSAWKARRCIVPASGFYEWQVVEGSKTKQPWSIYRADGAPMLMAGLWEPGKDNGPPSFTIVTTAANLFMSTMHDRMPVVLEPESVARWLGEPDAALLAPAADGVLTAHRIGTRVGNPRNNDETLIQPAA